MHRTLTPKERFGWGVFGGAGVPFLALLLLVRIPRTKLINELHATPLELWIFYGVVALALMIFGGMFAKMWEDDHPFKCWYVGITAPGLASVFALKVLQLVGLAG
jgi:hypothetical protein